MRKKRLMLCLVFLMALVIIVPELTWAEDPKINWVMSGPVW
jgi:hypothetical protein